MTHWSFSIVLHGEQGALNLSASLCHVLQDQGAQEYAANQTREEARHVTAFAKYIKARWGGPLPVGRTSEDLLVEIIERARGLQEDHRHADAGRGPGHGRLRHVFNAKTTIPLAKKLIQLVMTDEAFHHKFGKIWADRTIPQLTEDEHKTGRGLGRALLPDAAVQPGRRRRRSEASTSNSASTRRWVQRRREGRPFSDDDRREQMKEQTNIFRVLVKTLLNAGIITERTAPFYAMYVDMEELKAEGDRMVGDDIAEEMLVVLREINAKRRRIAKDVAAAASSGGTCQQAAPTRYSAETGRECCGRRALAHSPR